MDAISASILRCGYEELRKHQLETLQYVAQRKDCILCAPTGSGKSLVYESMPYLFENLHNEEHSTQPGHCMVIVVSPLEALMRTQAKDLCQRGIPAAYLSDLVDDKGFEIDITIDGQQIYSAKDIKDGKVNILFGSPEALLTDKVKKMLKEISPLVKGIVVDEAHCIRKFGYTCAGRVKPFRPEYSRLMEIRSLVGNAVCVAMTATATPSTLKQIICDLGIPDKNTIIVTPHKENIRYDVIKVGEGKDYETNLSWLVELIRTKKQETPRMLIFFRKMTYLTGAYEYLDTELRNDGYINFVPGGQNDDRNHLFEMYHMTVQDEVKDNIVKTFMNSESHLRVILCSASFSMGLNLCDVDVVIHYGVPSDADDYIQQTGRAGRAVNSLANAAILKYKQCLVGKNIKAEMKKLINTETCRRAILYQEYITDIASVSPAHRCCDNCALKCTCKSEDTCSYICEIINVIKASLYNESGSSSEEDNVDEFTNFLDDDDITSYRNRRLYIKCYGKYKQNAIVYFSDSDS